MKKCLKIFISMFIIVSFIITGCAKDNSMEGDPPGWSSAHPYSVEGRVMEIVGKNMVLINVLKESRDFQIGDTLAIKYDVSKESAVGLDSLEGFEGKPMEVQIGNIVLIQYFKKEKRDVGEIKDCNYVSPVGGYLDIIPEERYESMNADDAG